MSNEGCENKRVIGLVSGNNTGKTSIAECFLYNAKATDRLGKIESKNTVSDFSPLETKRGFSINSSILHYQWKNHQVNLVDCPGYMDFIGQTISTIKIIDGALLVIDPKSGMQAVTEKIIGILEESKKPLFCVMNKMDQENVDYQGAIDNLKERFGLNLVPITLPIGEGENFSGVIDALQNLSYSYKDSSGSGKKSQLDDASKANLEAVSGSMVESIIETDDTLLDKYLNGEEIDAKSINNVLKKAVLSGKVVPVFATSSAKNIGIDILMDYINDLLPSPLEAVPVSAKEINTEEIVEIKPSAEGPPLAFVFKNMADPYIGKLSIFRIFSGTFNVGGSYFISGSKNTHKFSNLLKLQGKNQSEVSSATCGDIVAVSKITDIYGDDTLSSSEKPLILDKPDYPDPIYPRAVMPVSKGDEEKIASGLARLIEEDPTISLENNLEVHQNILWGMGELHLAIIKEKLKEKFDIAIDTSTPEVAYKETIKKEAKSEYKYKKQSGGRGQYGHVFIEIKPLPHGEGFKFEDTIFGGSIPKNYIPGVEKGIREALVSGIMGGFPVVDVLVNLYDGSFHTVDSSEMAFKIAASMAFKKGMNDALPVMLEPIMEIEVIVPEEYMGDIIGDINAKRGKIINIGADERTKNQIIKASVPQAEIFNYAVDLKSITQGRGIFSQKFSHYDEMPHNIAEAVIEARKKKEENA
jgi:elongation factor G